VLLAFVVLLALSTLASTLALRQILLARTGERVEEALVQEVKEFSALARDGNNPLTGKPFGGDVKALFDVFRCATSRRRARPCSRSSTVACTGPPKALRAAGCSAA